jgi:hypothetical protein
MADTSPTSTDFLWTGPALTATEVLGLIESGANDPRLRWSADHSAMRVYLTRCCLETGVRGQAKGRRGRLSMALAIVLSEHGWYHSGHDLWWSRAPVQCHNGVTAC